MLQTGGVEIMLTVISTPSSARMRAAYVAARSAEACLKRFGLAKSSTVEAPHPVKVVVRNEQSWYEWNLQVG